MAAQIDLLTLAKVAALTSSGIFAGYTWNLSRAGVPSILDHGPASDEIVLPKWRHQYVDGATFSRPCCMISILSFGYLALQAHPWSLLHTLFVAAALLNGSGVPYALTALRRTNGALSIRCKRVLGPLRGGDQEPMALTYANHEMRSMKRETSAEWTTRRLLERWVWHNNIRSVMLAIGTVIGAYAVVLSSTEI